VCEFRILPNKKALDVQAFELNMTPGSHHFVVWEYLGANRDAALFPRGQVDSPGCIGVGPRDNFVANANLFGMQTSRGSQRFPRGVAVRLEPRAYVLLNLHIRNPSPTEPLRAEAVFNLRPARKGTVQHRAQTFTIGNIADISVPAGGTQSLTSEWHAPADLNVVQISTHQHKRGTHADIHLIDAAGNDLGQLVVTKNWEHPAVRWFDEGKFRLNAGEGLRFSCAWTNPDDLTVRFGVTSEDEMCFVTGYFYLDDDDATVTGPGCFPQGAGLQCFVPKLH